MLGKDIRYIKTDDVELSNPVSYFVDSTGFYFAYIMFNFIIFFY